MMDGMFKMLAKQFLTADKIAGFVQQIVDAVNGVEARDGYKYTLQAMVTGAGTFVVHIYRQQGDNVAEPFMSYDQSNIDQLIQKFIDGTE